MTKARERKPKPPFPAQPLEKPGLERDMDPAPAFAAPEYRAAGKLRGEVALITGGDSGIGRSVAVLFAREGADIAIVYLHSEQTDALETKAHIEAEGRRAVLLPGDVTDAAFCASAVAQCVASLGKLSLLVNNAAVQQHRDSLDELSLQSWQRTFEVNVTGYFNMVKAALPHLGRGAAIINTGSITGLHGSKELVDYSSTKGAIHAFTKSLSLLLTERGIRVNCVAPGPVWTPLNPAERDDEDMKDFGSDVPMGRPAQPEEIAPTYVFLASYADSSYLTGQVIALLGGETRAG